MAKLKYSLQFRLISLVLIVTFLALDIAYAYPPEHGTGNSTLAVPSLSLSRSENAIISSIHYIGDCYFGNPEKVARPLPPEYIRDVINIELGERLKDTGTVILNIVPVEYIRNNNGPGKLKSELKKIGFNGELPKEGVVFVLYKRGDKEFLAQIARRDQVSPDNLPGYALECANRYLVKVLPEGYREPEKTVAAPAVQATALASPSGTSGAGDSAASLSKNKVLAAGGSGKKGKERGWTIQDVAGYLAAFAAAFLFLHMILPYAKDIVLAYPSITAGLVLTLSAVVVALAIQFPLPSLSWNLFILRQRASPYMRDSAVRAVVGHARLDRDKKVIPVLINALGAKSNELARGVIDAFVMIGPLAEPHLVAALGDRNGDVRGGALETLRRLGRADAKLRLTKRIADLKYGDTETRYLAAEELGGPGGEVTEETISAFTDALSDSDAKVRGRAYHILKKAGRLTPELGIRRYIIDMGDDDIQVRSFAAYELILMEDARLKFMDGYLETVMKKPSKYYEALTAKQIKDILYCLDNDIEIEGRYTRYEEGDMRAARPAPHRPERFSTTLYNDDGSARSANLSIGWHVIFERLVVPARLTVDPVIRRGQISKKRGDLKALFSVLTADDYDLRTRAYNTLDELHLLDDKLRKKYYISNLGNDSDRVRKTAARELIKIWQDHPPAPIGEYLVLVRDFDDRYYEILTQDRIRDLLWYIDGDKEIKGKFYPENYVEVDPGIQISEELTDADANGLQIPSGERFRVPEPGKRLEVDEDRKARLEIEAPLPSSTPISKDTRSWFNKVLKRLVRMLKHFPPMVLIVITSPLLMAAKGSLDSFAAVIIISGPLLLLLWWLFLPVIWHVMWLKWGWGVDSRIEALADIGSPAAVSALNEILRYGDDHMRRKAALALASLGPNAARAIAGLVEALKDEDEDESTREISARALGRIGIKAVPALARAMKEGDDRVYELAATAAGNMGKDAAPAISVFIGTLRAKGGDRRKIASTAALGRVGAVTPEVMPALIATLGEGSEDLRRETIFALCKIGNPTGWFYLTKDDLSKELLSLLEGALADKNERVRADASEALEALINPSREHLLIKHMADLRYGDERVSKAAADAIGGMGPEALDAVFELVQMLGDGRNGEWVRDSAVRALAKIGPLAISELIKAMASGDDRLYELGAIAIINMGGEAKELAAPFLIGTLRDKGGDRRMGAAAVTLGKIDPAETEVTQALPFLITALENKDDRIRAGAMEVLGERNLLTTEHRVIKYTADLRYGDEKAREDAAESLGELGPKARRAVPVLAKVLKDKFTGLYVRRKAAAALGGIGSAETPEAINVLRAALTEDDDAMVRESAVLAFGMIRVITPDVVLSLVDAAVKDLSPAVRMNAAQAAVGFGANITNVVDSLVMIAENRNEYGFRRVNALEALGRIGHEVPQVAPIGVIISAAESADSEVREGAMGAMGRIGSADGCEPAGRAEIIAILRKGLKDPYLPARAKAAAAIGKIGPKAFAAIPDLIEILAAPAATDNDGSSAFIIDEVRNNAAFAIGRIGPVTPEAIHALRRALRDDSIPVRLRAAEALSRIDDVTQGDTFQPTPSQHSVFWGVYRSLALIDDEEARPEEYHSFVKSLIPDSMPNLRHALAELEPLSEREASDDEVVLEVSRVKKERGLSRNEAQILWLALSRMEPKYSQTKSGGISDCGYGRKIIIEACGKALRSTVIAMAAGVVYLALPGFTGAADIGNLLAAALVAGTGVGLGTVVVSYAISWYVVSLARKWLNTLRHNDRISDDEYRYVKDKLARLGERINPILEEALEDDFYYARKAAAEILNGRGLMTPGLKIKQCLINLADMSSDDARINAAIDLGALEPTPPEAVAALIKASRDNNIQARKNAVLSLRVIGKRSISREIVNALVERLGDDNHEVRTPAAFAFDWIGPSAVPHLQAILESSDGMDSGKVRMVAGILKKLAPEQRDEPPSLEDLLKKTAEIARQDEPVKASEPALVQAVTLSPAGRPLNAPKRAPDVADISAAVRAELEARGEVSFEELFNIVRSKIPESMPKFEKLRYALDSLEHLSESRDALPADVLKKIITETKDQYGLLVGEAKILELALLGPGQGGGAPATAAVKASEAVEQPDGARSMPPFEIVEACLNDRRARFARSGNREQFEADGIVVSLIALARRAKWEGQRLIIGLETDWIPGIKDGLQKQAISPLIEEMDGNEEDGIDGIVKALRSMGLDNVEIIHRNGAELAGKLFERADDTGTRLGNIVVLASQDTINSQFLTSLRLKYADENDMPFLAAIDPTELMKHYAAYGEDTNNQLYINLTKLLRMTLELAVTGDEPPQDPMISFSYDEKKRIVIFLPKPDPIEINRLRSAYRAEREALAAV